MNRSSRKILVVDDDSNVLTAYQEILIAPAHVDETAALMGLLSGEGVQKPDESLHSQPFDLVKASSAEEAIECFQQAFDSGEPFAMVFLDVRMPPGMSGIECGARLRAIDPAIYLVIATAYADYSAEEIREQIGVDFLYLKKPFVPEELAQVAELFSAYHNRDQQRDAEVKALRESVNE